MKQNTFVSTNQNKQKNTTKHNYSTLAKVKDGILQLQLKYHFQEEMIHN